MDEMKISELYEQMLLIRRFEERIMELFSAGELFGTIHTYIGQEAIAVGAIVCLNSNDYIATHYRDHGHALARGLEPRRVMAELFGKSTGTSKGKGGSMHLFDISKGFMGGYAIVGGMMPVATGLALSSKMLNRDSVTLCFLGDGAVNQGEFHESLNLAALWNLPVVFVCENNGYGMGTPVERTFAGSDISKLAKQYDMRCFNKVDGMNVLDVGKLPRKR